MHGPDLTTLAKQARQFPSPSPAQPPRHVSTRGNVIHRRPARAALAAGARLPPAAETWPLSIVGSWKHGVVVACVRREHRAPRPPPPLAQPGACPWSRLAAVPRAPACLALLQALGLLGGRLDLLLLRRYSSCLVIWHRLSLGENSSQLPLLTICLSICLSMLAVLLSWLIQCSCFVFLDACTIMSYNILADYNAQNHPDLYLDVPWDALRWDSRRRLIIREIRHWDPDLVCLQVRIQSQY